MSYKFYVDRKITMWVRDYYEVEANNPADAEVTMRKAFDTDDFVGIHLVESEDLSDTTNEMTFQDNGFNHTQELWRDDDNDEGPRMLKTNNPYE